LGNLVANNRLLFISPDSNTPAGSNNILCRNSRRLVFMITWFLAVSIAAASLYRDKNIEKNFKKMPKKI
jgi:hypothetical protein